MRFLSLMFAVCLIGLLSCTGDNAPAARVAVTPKVEARISVAPLLRDQLPADTVLYARIPSPWGLYAAPNGRVLDGAYAHPQHVAAIEQIRSALAAEPALNEGSATIARLLLSHWSGPVELALLAPGRTVGQSSQVLISMPVSGLPDAKALVALLSKAGAPPLDFDAEGYASLPNGAAYFDGGKGQVLVLGGDGVSIATLKEVQSRLKPAAPMFAASEARIDQGGQGVYFWMDLVAMRSAMAIAAMQAGEGAALFNRIAADGKSLAYGFGSVNGKGRMIAEIEAPGAGFLRYLAREPKTFAVRSAGAPTYAGSLSFLYSPAEFEQLRVAIKADFGAAAAEKFDAGLAEVGKLGGFEVSEMLAALGPDQVFFGDSAGDFFAVKVRDRAAWDALYAKLGTLPALKLVRNGDVHMLEIGHADAAPVQLDGVAGMFLRMRSRVFWADEGEYLLFASTPQALRDRKAAKPQFALDAWFKSERGPQSEQSMLMIAGQTREVAQRTYYFGLQMLQSLADMAGAAVDPFSFASARELDLPRSGTAGIGMEVSADRLAFVVSYDATGFDLLASESGTSTMTMVAVAGVLAAIAIPAYQDYIARSQVSEAIASTGAAKVAIAEHYFSVGELPDSLEELGVELDTRYAQLGWQDGLLLVQFHDGAPVNAKLRGQTVALTLLSNGSWACGYAQDADEGEMLGSLPGDVTSVPSKLLPSSCR